MLHKETKPTPIERLKAIIIIVPRGEADVYREHLKTMDVAIQINFSGHGTASKEIINMFNVEGSNRRDVLIALVRESRVDAILDYIQIRFDLAPKKKGVACVAPISAIIGKTAYNYLMNNNPQGGNNHERK